MEFIEFCRDIFGDDFYIEIAPSKSALQVSYNNAIVEIANKLHCKVIVATDAHYLSKDKRYVHKAYLASANGEREIDDFYSYSHFMDEEETFSNLFPYFSEQDFEIFCANTMEIHDKITGYEIFRKPIIPKEDVSFFEPRTTELGFPFIEKMLASPSDQDRAWINECLIELENMGKTNNIYLDRLNKEAEIIDFISDQLGDRLSAYFNTLKSYIDLFWEQGSIVGPGRGSAVGFLSNFLLGLTQIDPIKDKLNTYWRFLNKERVELPDIDIDICPSKRPAIFKSIRKRKGIDNRLLQVCAFSTEGSRSAIQTAARGYRTEEYTSGLPIEISAYLASLIPSERGFLWTIDDMLHGNDEKDRKPNKKFIEEMNKYPGLLDIVVGIEGLISQRTIHASGVILYNQEPWKTGAVMRSPNGDLITQYSLHDAEALGDTKFDFLVTEVSDKILTTMQMLIEKGYLPQDKSIREVYNEFLHPKSLDVTDEKIWTALANNQVIDAFQFNTDVGSQAAAQIKPQNPLEMTAANSLMRLMADKGKERPLDKYTRFKNDISLWYAEMKAYSLSAAEQECLKPYYLKDYGVPPYQESLMEVLMDENISNFTLGEANAARKIVAKKEMSKIPELRDKFFSKCESLNLAKYVWETALAPQMGYSFSILHSLAYSYVGIQTLYLATHFCPVYWNCACLMVNAGQTSSVLPEDEDQALEVNEIESVEDEEEDEDDTEEGEEEEKVATPHKKKKVKATDYGKISVAIGSMKRSGITIYPPDINDSFFTFTPEEKRNAIVFGLKGISKVNDDCIRNIIANRPYTSLMDVVNKIHPAKATMISLIKSGAFDCFNADRRHVLESYLSDVVVPTKSTITLANIPMLSQANLIDKSMEDLVKLYFFNKYIKKFAKGAYYMLDDNSRPFFENNFDIGLIIYVDDKLAISANAWDKMYDKKIEPLRAYLKANKESLIVARKQVEVQAEMDKYASGDISKWEMESLNFYYHDHELAHADMGKEVLSLFYNLSEETEITRMIYNKKSGKEFPVFKMSRICGTVLDKDKAKSSVTLLTLDGVVKVKFLRDMFANYNRQISVSTGNGKKKIVEKSWFTRGDKIAVTGFRRDAMFIAKKPTESVKMFHLVEKIIDIDKLGRFTTLSKRYDE